MKHQKISALLLLLASPIVVFATHETDRKIEAAAEASYNYRTVLENNVKVKAKDGVVTLTGTVQDKDERALAADTVENLPGVHAVKNEIVVKSAYPEKSDSWIALKIRGRLLVKGSVSATNTKVAVEQGVVTLTGTADNSAQKDLTEVYAKEIDGVRSVRNRIEVKERVTANDKAGDNRETLGEKIDDASITSQVKYALLTHKSTSAVKTKVTTTDGVVDITGNASSEAEKALVTKLAEDVRGTKSVRNGLIVRN